MSHQKSKWVIVFLIYADFRTDDPLSMNEALKKELDSMFKDIMRCPIDPETMRIYVIFDSIRYVSGEARPMIEDKTIFYEVKTGNGKGDNIIENCRILGSDSRERGEPGSINILQNASRLSSALTENVELFEDGECFLITWDHGSAFGIFREQTEDNLETQDPINYTGEYRYLDHFWERAANEPKLAEFISKKKSQPSDFVIRHGHVIYKVPGTDENAALYKKIVNNNQCLRQFRINQNTEDKKAQLVFTDGSSQPLSHEKINSIFSEEQKNAFVELYNRQGKYEMELGEPQHPAEILKNKELAQTIELWLGEKGKVGVLLMMNCWMMNLHTMYTLKDRVKCLVAPVGGIDSPGYNYRDILIYLANQPEGQVSPDLLAVEAVNTSHNDYIKNLAKDIHCGSDKEELDTIEYRGVFAVKLDYPCPTPLDQVVATLRYYFRTLTKLLQEEELGAKRRQLLHTVRLLSVDFTDDKTYYLVDIVNWLRIVYSLKHVIGFDLFIQTFADEIVAFCNNISDNLSQNTPLVLKRFRGQFLFDKKYDSSAAADQLTSRKPTGLSLFFPFESITDLKRTDNIASDALLDTFIEWHDLLQQMYPGLKY